MVVPSSRTDGVATVQIDYDRCVGCLLCAKVCKGAPLYYENDRICVDQTRGFGCIGCGHCMAVCPQGCITVTGRCLSADDLCEPSSTAVLADYAKLHNLMLKRRSVRNFSDKPVSREDIARILAAATTAPMGIPPSEVGVSVLDGQEKIAAFAADLIAQYRRMKWLFSKPTIYCMRLFMSKTDFDAFASFVPTLYDMLDQADRRGEDSLFYHAPLVMLFHASTFTDPVDSYIAATYAMLAAESLGLGSCMIGSVAPLLKNNRRLKEKYGIPAANKPGLAIIFGHPTIEYRRSIRRTFANIWFDDRPV